MRLLTLTAMSVVALTLVACGRGPGVGEDQAIPTPSLETSDPLGSTLAVYSGRPVGGRFLDERQGRIVRTSCTASRCEYQLVTTSDGGKTWGIARIPAEPIQSNPLDDAYVAVFPGGQVVADLQITGANGLLSPDGGRDWRQHRAHPVGVTAQVPGNAELVGWCPEMADCTEPVLRVMTADGRSWSFGPPPNGLAETVGATRAPDGSLWVHGRDTSGGALLAVSRNAGRSWTLTQLDTPVSATVRIVGRGQTAWALVLGESKGGGGAVPTAPDEGQREQSLRHSDDGGATFGAVRLPNDFSVNAGGALGVTADGRAVISGDDGRIGLVDASGQLTEVPNVRGAVHHLGAAVLVHGESRSWVSTDGQTWLPLPNP